MVRLDLPTLEQISAGLIKVQARGKLYPYPPDLQLGYDKVVLAFLVGGKALDVPASLPEFYELCEQPFEEWGVEIDRRGRGAGSGGQGERFWNSPATGFQAPGFSYEKEKNKYFETRSARNTASKLQAPPFMDGVSPCSLPPAPCLFLTTK